MRRPVSFAFLKQIFELISPLAQSLPNATSEEFPSIHSFNRMIFSRSVSTHENGSVLPVPLFSLISVIFLNIQTLSQVDRWEVMRRSYRGSNATRSYCQLVRLDIEMSIAINRLPFLRTFLTIENTTPEEPTIPVQLLPDLQN
jgi:hypothetical protein